jgi:small conductance mechanosensitive channel
MTEIVKGSMDFSTRSWQLLIHLAEGLVTWLAISGIRILVILALSWIALAALRRLVGHSHRMFLGTDASSERIKRANTLSGTLRTIGGVLIVVAASMMILNEIGIAIGPILATAGIGGLAVGFGAQTLVKDVLAGFFLLVEDRIRVGDIVQIGTRSGIVEAIRLRTLQLRDEAGNIHVIPNGAVDVVTNMTRDFSRWVCELRVPYATDLDRLFSLLREASEDLQKDPAFANLVLAPIEILGIDSIGGNVVVVKSRITTQAGKQWKVGRELNRRLKQRFDAAGIQMA